MTILKPMTQSCNDTFVSLQSSDDPEVLLDHLNNQHPRMKFTTETELDGHIPISRCTGHKDRRWPRY